VTAAPPHDIDSLMLEEIADVAMEAARQHIADQMRLIAEHLDSSISGRDALLAFANELDPPSEDWPH
jgi:hypothetical protein